MQVMLITTFITLILCTAGIATYGQTFSEWWRQKKTRIKYLHQQIAALEELEEVTAEGYDEAGEGVDSIETITMDEYMMDEAYLTSLGEVKPVFLNSQDVKTIYALATIFIRTSEDHLKAYAGNPWLDAGEWKQFKFDMELVRSDMATVLKELLICITEGAAEMRDDQRWKSISQLLRHVQMAGRFQMLDIMQMEEVVETRKQQAANDAYLKRNLR